MNDRSNRQAAELAEAFSSGKISRRGLTKGLIALGLAPAAAGAPLTRPAAAQSSLPADVSGEIRFMIGPWTDREVEHQETIAAAFNQQYPNVKFSFKLFSWDTATTEVDTSLAEGVHDIYYFGEGGYGARADQKNGFEDLTSRVNDPAWADEKAKYLHWDRLAAYSDKVMGLPICWHPEDALFVNMDMVRAAGFDETFADSWDTFLDCVTKMTKGTDVYGFGMGMQLGGFGEWYQRVRAAGATYLTADGTESAVNTPEVIEATQQLIDLFENGITPPQGTYNYDTAPDAFIAGKMAIYSSDLTIAAVLLGKPQPPTFEWAVLPWPAASGGGRAVFNDIGLYAMSSKTENKDLAWEVLKFWTSGPQSAYWTDVSGTYPARVDAVENGYGTNGAPQLAAAFDQLSQYSVGPEPFPVWDAVEGQAEAQAARAYGGEISAEDVVKNVETIIQQEAEDA